MKPCGRR